MVYITKKAVCLGKKQYPGGRIIEILVEPEKRRLIRRDTRLDDYGNLVVTKSQAHDSPLDMTANLWRKWVSEWEQP